MSSDAISTPSYSFLTISANFSQILKEKNLVQVIAQQWKCMNEYSKTEPLQSLCEYSLIMLQETFILHFPFKGNCCGKTLIKNQHQSFSLILK